MAEETEADPGAGQRHAAQAGAERAMRHLPFLSRGLSDRTIKALIADGIKLPEQLLFLSRSELSLIPRIGATGLAEIEAYQLRILQIRQSR